jgi:hypothetical protein
MSSNKSRDPVILAGPWIVDLFSLPGAASED